MKQQLQKTGTEIVAHAINNTIKNAKEELGMETDIISDGHHTFGDLYETIDSLCGKSGEWIFEKGKGLVARQYFEDNFEEL